MAENDWKKRLGVVYSTNPDFAYASREEEQEQQTLPLRSSACVSALTGGTGVESRLPW